MASTKIINLPSELLHEIFQHLDTPDIANVRSTCKAFQTWPIPPLGDSYTIKLHHPKQYAWGLARHLLFNPKACDRLTHLDIKWGKTFKRWVWTKRELSILKRLSCTGPTAQLT
ncbi:hypothetical protein AA313_de0200609 [Arthrobotrys entomopaga]|nr:hypothetical protein AA313_de0200609 [Arthrobotrys entomopaga]